MKKLSAFLLCFCITLLSCMPVFAIKGQGSASDPFLISTTEELKLISDFPDSCFKLVKNIKLDLSKWSPPEEFSGTLDGNGFTVEIKGKNIFPMPLIGKNIGKIINLNVDVDVRYDDYMEYQYEIGEEYFYAPICYVNSGIISQCSTNGGLRLTRNEHPTYRAYKSYSGFVAINKGSIENCYACVFVRSYFRQFSVQSHSFSGYLFVMDNEGIIKNCYATPCSSSDRYKPDDYEDIMGDGDGDIISSYAERKDGSDGSPDAISAVAMTMKATYSGWDFDNIWGIDPDINDGYPYLRVNNNFSVQEVSFDKTNIELIVGESETILSDTKLADILEWEISNEKVAELSNGVVIGKKEGTAVIKATTPSGNSKASCVVTVTVPKEPESVKIPEPVKTPEPVKIPDPLKASESKTEKITESEKTSQTPKKQKENITVCLDGKDIEFDVPPQLIGGRTMVPLRAIFEAIGASVDWDNTTKTVTAYDAMHIVKCTIGVNEINVNGKIKSIDVAPMIVKDRTLVPARFVVEAFGCDVIWDADTLTVFITSDSEIDYNKVELSEKNNGAKNESPSYSTKTTSNNTGTVVGTTTQTSSKRKCAVCKGSRKQECNYCHGKGMAKDPYYHTTLYTSLNGNSLVTCTLCKGAGSKICTACGGDGYVGD